MTTHFKILFWTIIDMYSALSNGWHLWALTFAGVNLMDDLVLVEDNMLGAFVCTCGSTFDGWLVAIKNFDAAVFLGHVMICLLQQPDHQFSMPSWFPKFSLHFLSEHYVLCWVREMLPHWDLSYPILCKINSKDVGIKAMTTLNLGSHGVNGPIECCVMTKHECIEEADKSLKRVLYP